ncbi:uncharacterized protein LOC121376745 [Gigantopelta aegis]|uniref:uncharacterized protein LOC121376745 n=1 Tax=Gigantopelta aegis TaxID=1735272 RepID=UPI001B888C27|nr:uncharacterized protein LOC121376745 [Gigantopelta aegis]
MSIVYNTVKKYCHWPWNWGYDVHAAGQHPMMGQSTDSKGQILQPADAIRFDCGGFQHWGVYVGEGQVVHMTAKGVEKAYVQEVANECPYFKDNSFDKVQGHGGKKDRHWGSGLGAD